jgi:primosomal protein N' (replication factor Y)
MQALLKTLHNNKPAAFEPKEILNVLDAEPLVYTQQLQLWQWIASYYMCSEGEVMNAAVPSNLKLSSESILLWNEEYGIDFSNLNDENILLQKHWS